ncbi:hypothetical protein [Streptomyces sp. NPDC059828]|uniref:hypothetical protein n=1 Tax=Streptomyces sp. NPDC059828 TaxID=3346965 RepID=UPI00365E958B
MTLTDNQSTDIWFVHRSVPSTWTTTQRRDLKYCFVSCTAEGTSCTATGTTGPVVNHGIPLTPGADRTVALTYELAGASGRNGDIGFHSYLYYEYNNGQSAKDAIANTPHTHVTCAPATPAPQAVRGSVRRATLPDCLTSSAPCDQASPSDAPAPARRPAAHRIAGRHRPTQGAHPMQRAHHIG